MSNTVSLSRVGLLGVESLWGRLWGLSPDDFLSAKELEFLGRLHHPRRRQEWLAVRVLAKYLFLSGAPSSTAVNVVGIGHLLSFPAFQYQELDVLPNRQGAPEMRHRGELAVPALSLSHAAGWAVAALSDEGSIGVDCELVEARRQAFLVSSFGDAEREWVDRHAANDGPSSDWLYTLLWSFKEAALKTGRIASLRAIDIRLHTEEIFSAVACRRFSATSRELTTLDWSVNNLAPHFAFAALPEWVLAVVHFPRRRGCV